MRRFPPEQLGRARSLDYTLAEPEMLNRGTHRSIAKNAWNVAALTLLAVVGCGGSADYGEPVSISGKVTLDGQPLKALTVVYHSNGGLPSDLRTQRAKTDDQGVYSLSAVYPGDYTILFEHVSEAEEPEDPGMAPAAVSATDAALASYAGDNAPTKNVTETTTEINFELKSSL